MLWTCERLKSDGGDADLSCYAHLNCYAQAECILDSLSE